MVYLFTVQDSGIRQLENIKIYDPSNIWLYMTLIDIYSHNKNYKKVEQLCKEAIAIDGTVANIYYELADALLRRKQYDESLQYSDKAILLRPNLWHLYSVKTSALIFLGLLDKCIDTCSYIISHAPEWYLKQSEFVYYNLAAAYARKGDVVNALKNIKKTIKIGDIKTIRSIRKDEDQDFYKLSNNPVFKRLLQGRPSS
jgi:tetratricopeptide (TPR) repeat protein